MPPRATLVPTPERPVETHVPVPATVLIDSVGVRIILLIRQYVVSAMKADPPSGCMAIPCGLPNVLVRSVTPLVLPAVHAVVPEQVPAYVVTESVARSSFLMALLFWSAIKA
jgi:hypothetical protein